MNKKYISITSLLLSTLLLWQCEPNVDSFIPSSGDANFSKFIAVGDSYTAGYTNGALGQKGQKESFAYIVSEQLASVGSTEFNQPLVQSTSSVGTTVLGPDQNNGYYQLQVVNGSLSPVPTVGDMAIFAEQVYNTENQNFGVPGAKSFHLLAPGYGNPAAGAGNFNPFYTRFMSSTSSSVINDAVAANATFISLWIGGNDVLGYALAGGEGDMITPASSFDDYMTLISQSLFSNDKKGVIANVPGIEALPYFSYIPYNVVEIDQATADALNQAYSQYNQISDTYGFDRIEFVAGYNALVIEDENYAHPAKIRQMKATEKVLLSASSGISNPEMGWGYISPLGAEYVLDETELSDLNAAVAAYNVTIKSIAEQYGLAFVDLHTLMDKLNSEGLLIDGNEYSTTFVTGGIFSLDGIHTTGRGCAIIANTFIEAINKQYKAQIPLANINDYKTVEFP
nr:hypothetical protein [uncultured Carboxylicivirga sp.]